MLDKLRGRSVKILHQQSAKGMGTGFLLDPWHILTCAHVIKLCHVSDGEASAKGYISEGGVFKFLPLESKDVFDKKAPQKSKKSVLVQSAGVVHSYHMRDTERERYHDLTSFTKDLKKANTGQCDFTQDLVLLKTQEPVIPNLEPIDWQTPDPDTPIQLECFGYCKEMGEELAGKSQGRRQFGLHALSFTNPKTNTIEGASGSVLLSGDSYAGNVVACGVLLAEDKPEKGEKVDSGYFIPGETIKHFLSSYSNIKNKPNSTHSKPKHHLENDIKFLSYDLPLSLIDRRFFDAYEDDLVQKGFVCLAVEAAEADWFVALGIRTTKEASLGNGGHKKCHQVLIEPPTSRNGKEKKESLRNQLLTKVTEEVSDRSYALEHGLKDDEIREQLHQSINRFDRVAIAIKLKGHLLYANERYALAGLIEQLQRYRRDATTNSPLTTQVLLYLVVDSEAQSPSVWDKLLPRLRLKTRSPLQSLLALFNVQYQNCEQHLEPLEPLCYSHTDHWIKDLQQLGVKPEYRNLLQKAAEDILSESQGIRHLLFRKQLIDILTAHSAELISGPVPKA